MVELKRKEDAFGVTLALIMAAVLALVSLPLQTLQPAQESGTSSVST